jgi:hypothetical protein
MLEYISHYLIFGKPLIMYLGILTLTSFLITALIGYTTLHGKPIVPFKWHPRMAAFSIALAIIHGILGILQYF